VNRPTKRSGTKAAFCPGLGLVHGACKKEKKGKSMALDHESNILTLVL